MLVRAETRAERLDYRCAWLGTPFIVDQNERYGDLTDEAVQMFSAETSVHAGTIVVAGKYMADLLAEMVRYLVTRN